MERQRNCVSVAQPCLPLCDSMNCSPPGSSVHEILQARILEWVAIPFSRGSSPPQGLNPGLLHWRQILYHLSHQGRPLSRIAKTILKKKNNVGKISLPAFKTLHGYSNQDQRDRHIDQWNRVENSEIDGNKCAQLIFSQKCKNNSVEERQPTNGAGTIEYSWTKQANEQTKDSNDQNPSN